MAIKKDRKRLFLGPTATKEEAMKAALRQEIMAELRRNGRLRDELAAEIMALPTWTPFTDVTAYMSSPAAREVGASSADLIKMQEELAQKDGRGVAVKVTVYQNSRYFVIARQLEDESIELSIRNMARDARHDWREFQRIKNELAGPDREAVEIYPAEDRLVDTANQFYVYVLPPGYRVPCGFPARHVSAHTPGDGTTQRDWEPGQEPPDCTRFSSAAVMKQLLTSPSAV